MAQSDSNATNRRVGYVGICLKLLSFAPIALLVFYSDLGSWMQELGADHLVGAAAATLVLFIVGIYLKERIFASYAQIRGSNFGIGLLMLAASATIYFVGSVYFQRNMLHFEALLLLAISYLLLRFDSRFVLQLLPLFALPAVIFVIPLLSAILGPVSSLILIAVFILALFGIFSQFNWASLIAGGLVLLCGFGFSFLPVPQFFAALACPLLALALVLPLRIRNKFERSGQGALGSCRGHRPSDYDPQFCLLCGRKLSNAKSQSSLNLFGLFVMVVITVAILAAQVPVLTINGTIPYASSISFTGISSSPAPGTPSGWLVNSSVPLDLKGDIYSSQTVYVPQFHPELSNYSLVYALGIGSASEGPGGGGLLPGWNISSKSFFSLGQFTGYLTQYTAGEKIMMNFAGTTQERFIVNGSEFEDLTVGISFSKQFVNTPSNNASSSFVNDLNAIFLPMLESESYHASWSNFLFKSSEFMLVFAPFVMTFAVGSSIAVLAYRIKLFDDDLDSTISRASGLEGTEWALYSRLLRSRGKFKTIAEIASELGASSESALDSLVLSLNRLRSNKLIQHSLNVRGNQVLLMWKVRS